ncbi:MAG: hypothetical protein ACRD6W_12080 [Nitrososphaerales archaeon]
MPKSLPVRLMLVAAVAGTASLAILLPSVTAAAHGPKPPVTATCTNLFGGATYSTLSGCSATSGAPKISSSGFSIVNGGDTGATIYWTDKKYTTESFTYGTVSPDTCPTLLGSSAFLEETETATITGGNSKLTVGAVSGSADVCIYEDSNTNEIVVQNKSNINL